MILGHADWALVDDIGCGDHHMHPGQRLGRRCVYALDARMHARRAQDLAVELPRQIDVVDVARLAAGLLRRVHFLDALAAEGIGCNKPDFVFTNVHGVTPCLSALWTEAMASTIFL